MDRIRQYDDDKVVLHTIDIYCILYTNSITVTRYSMFYRQFSVMVF